MVFALVDAFCAVCKKSHWCCILGGLGMWGLSFILFLTLIINLIQVIIVKETYEAVDACLILDYTNERQTCSGSGCTSCPPALAHSIIFYFFDINI